VWNSGRSIRLLENLNNEYESSDKKGDHLPAIGGSIEAINEIFLENDTSKDRLNRSAAGIRGTVDEWDKC